MRQLLALGLTCVAAVVLGCGEQSSHGSRGSNASVVQNQRDNHDLEGLRRDSPEVQAVIKALDFEIRQWGGVGRASMDDAITAWEERQSYDSSLERGAARLREQAAAAINNSANDACSELMRRKKAILEQFDLPQAPSVAKDSVPPVLPVDSIPPVLPENVDGLLVLAFSPDVQLRSAAVTRLSQLGDEHAADAVAKLTSVVRSGGLTWEARSQALAALRQFGKRAKQATAIVVLSLVDKTPNEFADAAASAFKEWVGPEDNDPAMSKDWGGESWGTIEVLVTARLGTASCRGRAALMLALARSQPSPEGTRALLEMWRKACSERSGCWGDDDRYTEAIELLGTKALPQVAEMLRAGAERERRNALKVVSDLGPSAAEIIPAIVEDVQRSKGDRDTGALWVLAYLGADAIKPLRSFLRDPRSCVRAAAATAFGRMGAVATPAGTDLIAALEDPASDVRTAAAITLGKLGPAAQAAIPKLRELAQAAATSDWVRGKIGCALAQIGDDPNLWVPWVCFLLKDPSLADACAALKGVDARLISSSLGNAAQSLFTDEPTIEFIAGDTKRYVRPICELLGADGPALAAGRLGSQDRRERLLAILMFCEFQPGPDVLALLERRIAEGDLVEAKCAMSVLARAGIQGMPALFQVVQQHPDPQFKTAAAKHLRSMAKNPVDNDKAEPECPAAIAAVNEALRDSDVRIRLLGVLCAGRLGSQGSESVKPLITLFDDSDTDVRRLVPVALGRIRSGDPEAIHALAQHIEDKDVELSSNCLLALERIGRKAHAVVPDVLRLLDSEQRPGARFAILRVATNLVGPPDDAP